jgi:hypothetical protein
MPCCGKRRRAVQARRLVAEQQNKRIFKSMRDKKPTLLPDKLLLDYHKKTHMLYAGAIARKPLNKPFINSTVDLHDNLVDEMLNRGMNHTTPLKKV